MPKTKRSEIKLSFQDGDMKISVFWPKGGNVEEVANVVGLLSVGAFLEDLMDQVVIQAQTNNEEDVLDDFTEIVDGYLEHNKEIMKSEVERSGPVVQPLHMMTHLMSMGGRIE